MQTGNIASYGYLCIKRNIMLDVYCNMIDLLYKLGYHHNEIISYQSYT